MVDPCPDWTAPGVFQVAMRRNSAVALLDLDPMHGADQTPSCRLEFARLREDLQTKGRAAKAAGQRHVSRQQMCWYIMTYADSMAQWVRFAETGVQTCGIPIQIVNQLKQVHASTEQTKGNICAGVRPFHQGDHDLFPLGDRPGKRDFWPLGDWGFPGDLRRR